jgi:general secretion pathway protein B
MDASSALSGYRIPGWLLIVYAALFTLLGWSVSGIWAAYRYPPSPSPTALAKPSTIVPSRILTADAVKLPTCLVGELTPLRYDAHVYADDPHHRSVMFSGQQYREGDRLPCGEIVAQIQPSLVILESGDRVVILDALEDWDGSVLDKEDR